MKFVKILGVILTAILVVALCVAIVSIAPANPVSIAFGRACVAVVVMIVGGTIYLFIVD